MIYKSLFEDNPGANGTSAKRNNPSDYSEEELAQMAKSIVGEHMDYLNSPEWREKSGGYDPSGLIADLQKAEFNFNPDSFILAPGDKPDSPFAKSTRVVRTPDGRVVVNVNPNQVIKGEPIDIKDTLYHEVGHIAYPNYGPATPEIVNQRMEMVQSQQNFQELMQDDSPVGQFFRENLAPIYESTAKGEMTGDEYSEKVNEVMRALSTNPQQFGLAGKQGAAISRNLMNRQVVPAHEIRQRIIESKMGRGGRLEKDRTFSPGKLKELLNTVAQNNNTGYKSLFA